MEKVMMRVKREEKRQKSRRAAAVGRKAGERRRQIGKGGRLDMYALFSPPHLHSACTYIHNHWLRTNKVFKKTGHVLLEGCDYGVNTQLNVEDLAKGPISKVISNHIC